MKDGKEAEEEQRRVDRKRLLRGSEKKTETEGDHQRDGAVSLWGEKGEVVRNYAMWGVGGRFDSVSICTRIPQDPFFQSLMPANLLGIFTQEKAILGNWLGRRS
jgi:hypothetical protein